MVYIIGWNFKNTRN